MLSEALSKQSFFPTNCHDREPCNPKNECAQIYFVQIFLKASAAKSTFMIGLQSLPAVWQKFFQARLHHQTPHPIESQKRMCPNLFRPNFFKSIGGQIDICVRASEPSCTATKVFPSTAAPPNPPPHRFLHVWLPRGGALSSPGGALSSIKNIITEAGLTTPRCWSSKIETYDAK